MKCCYKSPACYKRCKIARPCWSSASSMNNINLKKDNIGKKIDIRARKFLKQNNLDYAHGTGHGVGFFLNVHEGPQGISKYNNVKLLEGMILSNEPGFYKKIKLIR